MCGTCGCGQPEPAGHQGRVHHQTHPEHDHPGHDHPHHDHSEPHHHHEPGRGLPGNGHEDPEARRVEVETELLRKNDGIAAHTREWLAARRILALNLVSSPGAGKTTLLERTLRDLGLAQRFYVIEGDQQTDNDARRIEATGTPVLQINTGAMCHLDAAMVHDALHRLEPVAESVVAIENVGNLVCPSLFDLGEACKVLIASVTEGEDKPLKYPYMFRAAGLVLLNKVDLAPHVDFDRAAFREAALRVNPDLEILELSARSGEGLPAWYAWLEGARPAEGTRAKNPEG